jgi:hypothetical protein
VVTLTNGSGTIVATYSTATGIYTLPTSGSYTLACAVDGHKGAMICEDTSVLTGGAIQQIIGHVVNQLSHTSGLTMVDWTRLYDPTHPYHIKPSDYV